MNTLNKKTDIETALEIDSPSGKRKGLKKLIAAACIIAICLIVFLFLKKSGKPDMFEYKTEPVKRGNLTVLVTATGTLQPTNEVTVSTELSGILKTVEVDYNDKVKAGQILARLDTSKLEAQVTQYKAALESAKAKVLQSRATITETQAKLAQYRKVRELSSNKVPSRTDMDSAEAAYERAKADEAGSEAAVSQAKANLDAAETDLSKSVIRSPINGIVLSRKVEPGQTMAASLSAPTLFTLAEDLRQMELHVNVDEADVGKVRKDQKATFTVAAHPDRTFNALIREVRFGSSTTSGVVTYETVLTVNNSDMSLRPGMTATADIVVENIAAALLVPGAALRFSPPVNDQPKTSKPSGGGLVDSLLPHPPNVKTVQKPDAKPGKNQQVWILSGKKLLPLPVTAGSTNGVMTEIKAGSLKEGMQVVTDVISGVK